MPLVGLESVAELLPTSVAAPLRLHAFVALGSSQDSNQCLLLDFLPERPTDPAIALALASGRGVPGILRVRQVDGWIRGKAIRTRLAGHLEPPLSDPEAQKAILGFNRLCIAWSGPT
ncbi:hypothetical protein GPECTOR_13g712 [Gonium pectorale]|uniref:Uncharacterized protein n=1 Tax=Gonium pectorale TaxID=33097 RepID=A0A150GN73_GONPE|nr:hypothetical protein GPECTOR_13g712 [Gonium pectorale]|eukprot:KXZ51225.1 hypothetical protein GPECTOR_13g712 [Gonium pectorale]